MTHPAIAVKNLAIITGGASGIGLAVAKALSSRYGMNVAMGDIVDSVHEAGKNVQQTAKEGAKVWAGKVDVTDGKSIESFSKQVQR